MNIPIPNDGTSLILKKTLSENMKNNVMKKINKRELYSEVEL
jgi:choline/ethanolamine kinase